MGLPWYRSDLYIVNRCADDGLHDVRVKRFCEVALSASKPPRVVDQIKRYLWIVVRVRIKREQ